MHLLNQEKQYKLRTGVFIAADGSSRVYIGLPHRGVSLSVPAGLTQDATLLRLAELFNSHKAESEKPLPQKNPNFRASSESWTDESEVFSHYIESCIQLNLIEEAGQSNTEPSIRRNSVESAQSVFFNQLYLPEKHLESWRKNSPGEKVLNERANTRIAVYGENRLALALLSTIVNSGYQVTHLSPRSQINELEMLTGTNTTARKKPLIRDRISTEQLCGIGASVNDVGVSFEHFAQTQMENSGWSYLRSTSRSALPRLIIATQQPQAEHLQMWMSSGTPHLVVSSLVESFIEIGPVVIPGKTTCYRCINLWKIDLLPQAQPALLHTLTSGYQEMPSSAIALITGHLLLTLNTYFAEDESCLLNSTTLRINLFDPCFPTHIPWHPHSLCGCMEIV